MDRWTGKTALVTGASVGLGAAIAVALAEQGMNVVAVARRVEKVQDLVEQLTSDAKGEIFPMKGDVSNEKEIYEIVSATKQKYGGIDVLVNNAGICETGRIVEQKSGVGDEFLNSLINTNVKAPVILARESAVSMKERDVSGHIINISSVTGHHIIPSCLVYPASKSFINALSEILRREISDTKGSIKITNLSPGVVRTAMSDNVTKQLGLVEENGVTVPMIDSKDIADAIVYVLSTPPNVNISEMIIQSVGEFF